MATKKADTTETTEAPKAVGRAPSIETLEFRKQLKKLASRKAGVTNIEAATEMGVTTLKASALANSLIAAGEIEAKKGENGRVTYFKAAKVLEAA
jgi:hypothetical protein